MVPFGRHDQSDLCDRLRIGTDLEHTIRPLQSRTFPGGDATTTAYQTISKRRGAIGRQIRLRIPFAPARISSLSVVTAVNCDILVYPLAYFQLIRRYNMAFEHAIIAIVIVGRAHTGRIKLFKLLNYKQKTPFQDDDTLYKRPRSLFQLPRGSSRT